VAGAASGRTVLLPFVSVSEPVHDLFAPALDRKRVRYKADDAGNNGLLPRSPTQYMALFRFSPTGSGSIPGIAGSDRRGSDRRYLSAIRHCPERQGEKIVNRL